MVTGIVKGVGTPVGIARVIPFSRSVPLVGKDSMMTSAKASESSKSKSLLAKINTVSSSVSTSESMASGISLISMLLLNSDVFAVPSSNARKVIESLSDKAGGLMIEIVKSPVVLSITYETESVRTVPKNCRPSPKEVPLRPFGVSSGPASAT